MKNRPDPPNERNVREIVRGVEALQKAVDRYSQAGGQTRSETWRQLGTVGELRSIDPALSILSSPVCDRGLSRHQDEIAMKIIADDRLGPKRVDGDCDAAGAE